MCPVAPAAAPPPSKRSALLVAGIATALRFGFRAANPNVPMKSTDGDNPFVKMAPYGLSLELSPATRPPDGAVLRNLMMMWSRVVKPT